MCQIMKSSIVTAKILFVLWTNINVIAIKLTIPGVESPIILALITLSITFLSFVFIPPGSEVTFSYGLH